ncbi:MAG: hypothetical protein JNL39_00775, partial [Opitutaceae bacterium]|nr:hypothetical protein [Opitutaceae bacterium]
ERWRLIVDRAGGRVELFDLAADPQETRNVAAAQPDVVRELLARLERIPQPRPDGRPKGAAKKK